MSLNQLLQTGQCFLIKGTKKDYFFFFFKVRPGSFQLAQLLAFARAHQAVVFHTLLLQSHSADGGMLGKLCPRPALPACPTPPGPFPSPSEVQRLHMHGDLHPCMGWSGAKGASRDSCQSWVLPALEARQQQATFMVEFPLTACALSGY